MSNRQYTRQSPRASSKMASSSSSKPNKSLLKAALTKNVTLSDTITPNTSTITPNTTAMEIEKVKRNHNQMQVCFGKKNMSLLFSLHTQILFLNS